MGKRAINSCAQAYAHAEERSSGENEYIEEASRIDGQHRDGNARHPVETGT